MGEEKEPDKTLVAGDGGVEGVAAHPRRCHWRILFVCTEDWFFLSHFQPLAEAAETPLFRPAIVTTTRERRERLERLGLDILEVDFRRHDFGLLATARLLARLTALLRRARPDIVHLIALKPIVLGGLAALALPSAACVHHLTGLGVVGAGRSRRAVWLRGALLRVLALLLRRRRSWLLVENRDDLALLQRLGAPVALGRRATLLGGAGVDPEHFKPLEPSPAEFARAAYVGRMVWSKGVDVLIAAQRLLTKRGTAMDLDLYGAPDPANPRAIPEARLRHWAEQAGVRWQCRSNDVRAVLRHADMVFLLARGGDGVPRRHGVAQGARYAESADHIQLVGVEEHLGLQGARRLPPAKAMGANAVRHRLNGFHRPALLLQHPLGKLRRAHLVALALAVGARGRAGRVVQQRRSPQDGQVGALSAPNALRQAQHPQGVVQPMDRVHPIVPAAGLRHRHFLPSHNALRRPPAASHGLGRHSNGQPQERQGPSDSPPRAGRLFNTSGAYEESGLFPCERSC